MHVPWMWLFFSKVWNPMKAFLCQNHIENGNGHAIPKEIMPIRNMLAEGTFRTAFFLYQLSRGTNM